MLIDPRHFLFEEYKLLPCNRRFTAALVGFDILGNFNSLPHSTKMTSVKFIDLVPLQPLQCFACLLFYCCYSFVAICYEGISPDGNRFLCCKIKFKGNSDHQINQSINKSKEKKTETDLQLRMGDYNMNLIKKTKQTKKQLEKQGFCRF